MHRPLALTLFALLALAHTALAHAQPAPDARASLREGAAALEQGRAAQAIAPLERAVALGAGPLAHFNLALAYRAVGRHVEAVASFDRYLAEPEPNAPAERLAAVRDERAELFNSLAALQLRVRPADATLTLDARPRAPSTSTPDERTFTERLDPGPHTLTLTAPRHRPLERTFEAPRSGSLDWQLALTPEVLVAPPVTRAPLPPYPWWSAVGGAVALAGIATTAALAANGARIHSEWERSCMPYTQACTDTAASTQSALDAHSTGVTVSALVGGAGLSVGVTGLVWWATRPRR